MLDPVAFKHCIDLLVERYREQKVDVIAGARVRVGTLMWAARLEGGRRGWECIAAMQCRRARAGSITAIWVAAACRVARCGPAPRAGLSLLLSVRPLLPGFEARGLIFGAPLALALGVAFVPLRKPGKLPGESPVTVWAKP